MESNYPEITVVQTKNIFMDLTFPIKKKYRLKKKYTVKYKVIPIVTEGSKTILRTFERYLSKLGKADVQVGTYATAALVTE